MPCVSRFFGIAIYFYYDDHNPPHFHARYGGASAGIEIESLRILFGELSPRALALVAEWAELHREELQQAWARARQAMPLNNIAPLE